MSNPTVIIDGRPVAAGTARAFESLRAAFQAATGKNLLVTDGLRTYEEQAALYAKWKAGTANLAAAPGTSKHETGRALDLRDSGADRGVTFAGNERSNWLRAHAAEFGFTPSGYTFSPVEPWHYDYTGDPWGGETPAPAPTPSGEALKVGSRGPRVRALQEGLNKVFPAYSKLVVDEVFGNAVKGVVQEFQRRTGLDPDGIAGRDTIPMLARYGIVV